MYEFALACSVLTLVLVTAAFARSRAFSVFHPLTIYIAFHGFLFVIRPIVAYAGDFDYIYRLFQFTPSLSDKITVLFASNLGFLAFAAACWRTGNRPMVFRHDRITAAERVRLMPLFLWVAVLCVPLGAYSLSLIWNSAVTTGFAYSDFVRDANTGTQINTGANGYIVEAQLMLATCAAIVAWLFRFRLLAILPLVAFIVFRAGTGGRGPFIAALGAVGLLYLYEQRRKMPTALVMIVLPAVALLFNAVGTDRGASIRRALGASTTAEISERYRSDARPLEGQDFANLEYFEFLVYVVPQRSGTYGYFNDVLQIFTEPVPRAVWKDKPAGAPFARIQWFDYGYPVTMSFSLPGEGWYSLGWIGVIAWCSLCGWALGWLYRRFVEGPQSSFHTIAYMVFLPTLILSFRDGQLVTVFRQGLFFMAPIVLWWLLARLMGVPKLEEVRKLLVSRAQAVPTTAERPVSPLPALPAAVRRRRRALASGPPEA